MTLLVLSPDYASHYGPLAVVAAAARDSGRRVVVATGDALRPAVEGDGFEWVHLQLGAASNRGDGDGAAIDRFLDATRAGPIATLRHQATEREHDLLWNPAGVAAEVAALVERLRPEQVLVDHVSFGSTLAMYAIDRPFVTLVPGHPTQLPADDERYGVPAVWPQCFDLEPAELTSLDALVDRVGATFTARWNAVVGDVAPDRPPVTDAHRVHGGRVLYNSVAELHSPDRALPADHRFVGPLVRAEELPAPMRRWLDLDDGRPLVYVALGTFLSQRGDVLAVVADALRAVGARAAIATGPTPARQLGPIPDGWLVEPHLPQVALLPHCELAVHHGGNNSVQECLAAGTRQIVAPFSTDQFANAADLERESLARVVEPGQLDADALAAAVEASLLAARPHSFAPRSVDQLMAALFD